MKLILGGINGHYLRDITENAARETEEVLAAVAYATHTELLCNRCLAPTLRLGLLMLRSAPLK